MDSDDRPDLYLDPWTRMLTEGSPGSIGESRRQFVEAQRGQSAVAEDRRRVMDIVRSRERGQSAFAEDRRRIMDIVRSREGEEVYDEERGELVRRRRRGWETRNPNSEPSSSRVNGTEECAREVNSSADLFNAPALNDMPPEVQSPYWSTLPYDTGSSDSESETVENNPNEESDFDLEKELQELREYLEEHTSDTISEGMDKILAVERATLAAEYDKMSAAQRADMTARSSYFSLPPTWCLPSPAASEARSLQVTEQASSAESSRQHFLRRQPRHEVSDEEIIQNGKDWMNKEVMLAFDKYKERSSNLKGLDCQFVKLNHQCFNVEHYSKIFHHYNFTMKITNPSSSDSREALFFAEVKEILGRAYYFCCPLERGENGRCHACHNQEMDDLQHPATGGYDRGLTDTVFPFMYLDDRECC